MSLARVWRRQLFAASSAAVLVPCAMLAALVALALGGGFSQVGVLGQIFAGPPAVGSGTFGGANRGGGGAGASGVPSALPVIPATRTFARPPALRRTPPLRSSSPSVPVTPHGGTGMSGGAIAPGPATTRTLTRGSGAPSRPSPTAPTGPSAPAPPAAGRPTPSPGPPPSPTPQPQPQPTPVATVVTVVTTVTKQIPGPAGSAATQAVQSAGTTAGQAIGLP